MVHNLQYTPTCCCWSAMGGGGRRVGGGTAADAASPPPPDDISDGIRVYRSTSAPVSRSSARSTSLVAMLRQAVAWQAPRPSSSRPQRETSPAGHRDGKVNSYRSVTLHVKKMCSCKEFQEYRAHMLATYQGECRRTVHL